MHFLNKRLPSVKAKTRCNVHGAGPAHDVVDDIVLSRGGVYLYIRRYKMYYNIIIIRVRATWVTLETRSGNHRIDILVYGIKLMSILPRTWDTCINARIMLRRFAFDNRV